jgi:hypothetical protein
MWQAPAQCAKLSTQKPSTKGATTKPHRFGATASAYPQVLRQDLPGRAAEKEHDFKAPDGSGASKERRNLLEP